MSTPSSHAVVPLALVAGGMVLAVAACGSGSNGPAGTTGPAPTATVTATATETTTQTATQTATATSAQTSPASAGGRCTVGDLRIRYADDAGGAGAGSVTGTLTFTNTSSASCTLGGFPGVSYVTASGGAQVGAAARRSDDSFSTVTIAAGKSATAALRRSQPGPYGDECQQTSVAGLRVYPPESKEAAFVAFRTTGCKSLSAPLLTIAPVEK